MLLPFVLSLSTRLSIFHFLGWVTFLFALSQVYIPLLPVPITGQIMAFLLLGLLNNPKDAFYISLSYVILGILGLPLFHGLTGGLGVLSSTTFGYILGYPLVAISFSLLKEYIVGIKTFFFFSFISLIPCYILGMLFLCSLLGFNKFSLYSGFIIFIPAEIIKITLIYTLFYNKKPLINF